MATIQARATAIVEGIVNRTVDGPTMIRMSGYFITLNRIWIEDQGMDPDALTIDERAWVLVQGFEGFARRTAKDAKGMDIDADNAALLGTAEDDFTETP